MSRKSVLKRLTCHTFLRLQYLDHVQCTVTDVHRVTAGSDFSRIPLCSGKCAGRIIPHMTSGVDASRVGPGLDFHVAIDAIPALAWSSHSGGSVDYVNQRWREYTGLSPEESYGRGWKTAIYPDDLATLAEKWEALDDANAAQACEVRLRRSDGVFRRFWFRRDPLRDETGAVTRWYGTGIDIDRAKQKETLHAAEKRTLEMVADGASIREVLDHICAFPLTFRLAPSVTMILLMDEDGKTSGPTAGPKGVAGLGLAR